MACALIPRTRSRDDGEWITIPGFNRYHSDVRTSPPYQWYHDTVMNSYSMYLPNSESITDEVVDKTDPSYSTRGPSRINRFKELTHTKDILTMSGFNPAGLYSTMKVTPENFFWGPDAEFHMYGPNMVSYVPNASDIVQPLRIMRDEAGLDTDSVLEVTDAELRQGLAQAMPDVASALKGNTTSLANFLIELKDLRRLTDLATIHGDSIDQAANTNLGVNFGVIPLVSDIKKMNYLIKNLDSYITKWNDFARKSKIMDFHTTIWDFSTEASLTKVMPAYYEMFVPSTTYTGKIDRVAKLHLYAQPLEISDSDRFRIKLRALGLNKPFGIAWEAMPFSWLIDYVANIQQVINQYEAVTSLFRVDIHEVGYSVKNSREAISSTLLSPLGPLSAGGPGAINGTQFTEIKSHYIRRRLNPALLGPSYEDPDLELRNNLTPVKTTYVASLLAQYFN